MKDLIKQIEKHLEVKRLTMTCGELAKTVFDLILDAGYRKVETVSDNLANQINEQLTYVFIEGESSGKLTEQGRRYGYTPQRIIGYAQDKIVKAIEAAGYVPRNKQCPDLNCDGGIVTYKNRIGEIITSGQCLQCNGTGEVPAWVEVKEHKPRCRVCNAPLDNNGDCPNDKGVQLVELAEDQSLPENPYNPQLSNLNDIRHEVYSKAQRDMINAGWRKIKEKGNVE